MGRSAGRLAAAKAYAINSVTINRTGLGCSRLAVTWQACRYLIDLSGKRLVT